MARLGAAWRGSARQGKGHSVGVLRIVSAAGECYGLAGPGLAGRGAARRGMARQGHFGAWWRFRKSSRRGRVWHGVAGHGKARRGEGFYFQTLTG